MWDMAGQKEYQGILAGLRDPNQRSWIMLNPTSIGDTAIVCGFAREFVKRHGYGITLVVPEDHLPIVKMYPDRFIRVFTVDRPGMHYLLSNYVPPERFEVDVPFCAHPYDLGDGRIDQLLYLFKYPGRGGLTNTDAYRYLLRLPWDAPLDRPKIPAQWDREAAIMAEDIGMEVGKSVILFPANSSPHPQFRDVFWSALAARLQENGYKVFTNMKGGNVRPQTMPIAGTTPIEVPVHLAPSLVSLAGRSISGAHGLQLLIMLGAKFRQMSVAMPVDRAMGDFKMNGRDYHSSAYMAQFMYPELCVDVPFAEFLVPYDESDAQLERLGRTIADESFDDPYCFKRMASGQPYIEQNEDWLRNLTSSGDV
jgi:hypothetical protein